MLGEESRGERREERGKAESEEYRKTLNGRKFKRFAVSRHF